MPRKYLNKVIFQATNNHDKLKGNPPLIDTTDKNKYCAYFENDYREQLIFVYDYLSHTGMLWLSKKGWENPFKIIDGKALNSGLGNNEKTWLKACWNVATAVDHRRENHRKQLAEQHEPKKPVITNLPTHDEIKARMEHLYDALAKAEIAPNCSKQEFVSGWTGFIEFTNSLEEKYKDQLAAKKIDSE